MVNHHITGRQNHSPKQQPSQMNAAVNAIRHNQRQMMTAVFKIIQRSPSMIRAPQMGTMTQTQQFSSQQQREMDEAILSELVKQLSLITQQISIQQQREMNEAILSELVKQLSLITQQQQSVMNEAIPSEQVLENFTGSQILENTSGDHGK
jgi:hypothetical protein